LLLFCYPYPTLLCPGGRHLAIGTLSTQSQILSPQAEVRASSSCPSQVQAPRQISTASGPLPIVLCDFRSN
jgi:hypothetical protein